MNSGFPGGNRLRSSANIPSIEISVLLLLSAGLSLMSLSSDVYFPDNILVVFSSSSSLCAICSQQVGCHGSPSFSILCHSDTVIIWHFCPFLDLSYFPFLPIPLCDVLDHHKIYFCQVWCVFCLGFFCWWQCSIPAKGLGLAPLVLWPLLHWGSLSLYCIPLPTWGIPIWSLVCAVLSYDQELLCPLLSSHSSPLSNASLHWYPLGFQGPRIYFLHQQRTASWTVHLSIGWRRTWALMVEVPSISVALVWFYLLLGCGRIQRLLSVGSSVT